MLSYQVKMLDLAPQLDLAPPNPIKLLQKNWQKCAVLLTVQEEPLHRNCAVHNAILIAIQLPSLMSQVQEASLGRSN